MSSFWSWLDQLSQALSALRDNRLRTILSIVSIAVGTAAVMAVSSISRGGEFLVFRELETFVSPRQTQVAF